MKRRTKKTFFELKVTFFFDLFDFWIGGYYDYKKKALYLSLIPTLVIKLEKDFSWNGKTITKDDLLKQGNISVAANTLIIDGKKVK